MNDPAEAPPYSAISDSPVPPPPPYLIGVYALLALILIGSLAAIVHYTSRLAEVTEFNSNRVELTSRQRANSQRLTKALLMYERDQAAGLNTSPALAEIDEASEAFNNVLKGYDSGTKITALTGKEMFFPASTDQGERRLAEEAKNLWVPLFEKVKRVSSGKASKAELSDAVNMARELNTPLFDLMNGLTLRSDAVGQEKVNAISGKRNICIGIASVTLFLIPGVFLINRVFQQRKIAQQAFNSLEKTYGELSSMGFAKAETDRIMETVQEGLFLITPDGTIGEYHSKEAPLILRQEQLAGADLYAILKRYLSEKMYNTSRDFFELLFNASRKEKTVLSVNPLTDVEVNFPNPAGGFITRYLGFSFRRIMVDGRVDRLFVALRDVTKQVELENQLRESEKTKEREMQILLSIVHVPQEDLEGFVQLAEKELESINQTLRAEDFAASGGRSEALRSQLDSVYRSVHNLNGNASLLQLNYFQKAAHDFETRLKELLTRPSLSGDDFLSIVVAQADLRGDLNDLKNLRSKLGNISTAVRQAGGSAGAPANPSSALSEQLRKLVTTISGELGKSAELVVDEYALHAFSHGRTDLVRDVLVQLLRNAVAHGVEPADVREASGKPRMAQLSIHALPAPAPGVIGLAVRDDGRGLDLERIQQRAISRGLLPADHPARKEEIIQCIFESGFSTSETADLHSGRGVGMDIVKSKFVNEANGCIEILSESAKFCEFRLYIPS